jgi:microcystin-dependent protein
MIWHDDYRDFMVWMDLAIGYSAEYHGYASVNLGAFHMDTAWRDGYLPITYSVSKTTYAALWAWALDRGLVVPLVSYVPGNYNFSDNGNGTFKLPDLGGFFPRIYDITGNIDVSRGLLTGQAYQMSQHAHLIYGQDNSAAPSGTSSNEVGNVESAGYAGAYYSRTSGNAGGSHNNGETRPYNTAFAGMIKF